jgi:hypothetical protein
MSQIEGKTKIENRETKIDPAFPARMRHWGIGRDPFSELDSPYVSLPSHDEAVARLVHVIERSQRRAVLTAAAGMGKSTVLRKALVETQSTRRRFARVPCPWQGGHLFTLLAERLGERVGREPGGTGSWRALERVIRISALEGVHVVIAVDDCDDAGSKELRRELDSLVRFGSTSGTKPTIIEVGGTDQHCQIDPGIAWGLVVGLEPLTRSEAERYLRTKLVAAGCIGPVFTPRAITRLHCLSRGVPRGLEQLASLSLSAGAVRGLEMILPDLVDGVADACRGDVRALTDRC